jgi:AcrR family transcriptional regulator
MLLLDEGGGKGLTMRSLASRLGVTPMSLYHHVVDRAGLLLALSDRVYGEVLDALALEIFAEPEAFAGVSRQITDRLTSLLAAITAKHLLWRDILVDHAHGSGLALSSARGDQERTNLMRGQYREALDCLLERLVDP